MLASTLEPGKQTSATRSPRVLACIPCSRRKIKCNRVFPCVNCERASIECVPAAQTTRRRRRFPERELLERIRYYEGLLRQNNLTFSPLHPEEPEPDSMGDSHTYLSSRNQKPVDFFEAIGKLSLDSDSDDDRDHDVGDKDIRCDYTSDNFFKSPWAQVSDHLLFFGAPTISSRLLTLHPEQIHVFRLWQIYLDNVNPLLKVTHTPTLQARVIDAISDLKSIQPAFQALLFSIYCVSVMSLPENECTLLFGTPKDVLLSHYHSACQQALRNCNVLRSDSLDGLTALYLYLISVRAQSDPRSLSSILATAIRIAKRNKMHDESSYSHCDALEAEMRRRLWWSLTLFDHRICEMSDFRDTSLVPTWDCMPPRNVNDLDLRLEMKSSPAIHSSPTEAIFAVVRSELANFIRYIPFHIDFINPSLNAIAQPRATQHLTVPSKGDDLMPIETILKESHLATCDPENPLHFMTIWTTRSTLARNRLLEYYSQQSMSPVLPTATQRNTAIACALRMIECDTKLRMHARTRGFLWFLDMYLPAIAFNYILHGLRNCPDEDWADEAWAAMSANYEARAVPPSNDKHRNLLAWIPIVLHVWHLREASLERRELASLEVPHIVTRMSERAKQMSTGREHREGFTEDTNALDEFRSRIPTDLGGPLGHGLDTCLDMIALPLIDTNGDQVWTTIDWDQI